MLITWRNRVSNSAGKGVWLMDGRWDGGLAKADCSDWESGFRMNQPTPDYTTMVQTWKICWDMLGKDWDMLGKRLICCKLSAYCRCCNIRRRSIRCVMPDTDSLWILFWCSLMMVVLPKMLSSKFRGWYDDNGVVPLSWSKRVSQWKKFIGHLNFNIWPFGDSIVSDNLV